MTSAPAPVSTLLRAIEARDMETIQAAFTPDAAIHDEGEIVHGPAGVERWANRVFSYAATFAVDDVTEKDDETIVTTTVAGEFPGSPPVFFWHLDLEGERIASLRITL